MVKKKSVSQTKIKLQLKGNSKIFLDNRGVKRKNKSRK
jgi:hypothetical protein